MSKNPKSLAFVLLAIVVLVIAIALVGCSAKTQVRLEGTISLGELPSDVLYVNNIPQIVSVSTESDGLINLVYISTDSKLVSQMYGCAIVTLTCGDLHMQGRYEWDITEQRQEE